MTLITFDFTPSNPQPPRPTTSIRVIVRVLKSLISRLKVAMSREYRDLLPVVIPAWWSVERVAHFADGNSYPQPVHVATITRLSNVRTGYGMVGKAMERAA